MVVGVLLDVCVEREGVGLWVRTQNQDVYVKKRFVTWFAAVACSSAEQALNALGWTYSFERKKLFSGKVQAVCVIPVVAGEYHRRIKTFSERTRFRVPLFNADIPVEQRFLSAHGLQVGKGVDTDSLCVVDKPLPALVECSVRVLSSDDVVSCVIVDDQRFTGLERDVLAAFAEWFVCKDPDVLFVFEAFSALPLLDRRLRAHNLFVSFHRFSSAPLRYRGGRSFFSYGQVRFRDFSFRLKGRLLIDSQLSFGDDIEGLLALAQLSFLPVGVVAARSAGACFQGSLVHLLLSEDVLVSYKQKPLAKPVSMSTLVSQDRAGLTLDPVVGVHEDVAELDFASLFPTLIAQKNISAETLSSSGVPCPDVDVSISQDKQGFIARAIQPFLALREEYRRDESVLSQQRSDAVKGVLVSANGYLRYREFKLGVSTTHVALCSWARQCLLVAKRLAEERGFRVVAGLIDSVYIHKKGLQKYEVLSLAQDISCATGVRVKCEGVFSWVAFCPSATNPLGPARTHYFGAFVDGGVKIRGLRARRSGTPRFVRQFQKNAVSYLAQFSPSDVRGGLVEVCRAARTVLSQLQRVSVADAAFSVRLTKDSYGTRSVQQQLSEQLGRVIPGRRVFFVFSSNRPVLVDDFSGTLCVASYRKELLFAVKELARPFGVSDDEIMLLFSGQQSLLSLPTGHARAQVLLNKILF